MKKMRTYRDFLGELTVNYKRTKTPIQRIQSSKDAASFIRPYFENAMDDHEEVKVIHVNNYNYIVNVHHASSGTETSTLIPIKTIVRNALQIMTSGIILVHNHPSGTTKFSDADIEVTKKLRIACGYFDIQVLDSLIITRESYASMGDEGLI